MTTTPLPLVKLNYFPPFVPILSTIHETQPGVNRMALHGAGRGGTWILWHSDDDSRMSIIHTVQTPEQSIYRIEIIGSKYTDQLASATIGRYNPQTNCREFILSTRRCWHHSFSSAELCAIDNLFGRHGQQHTPSTVYSNGRAMDAPFFD